MLADPAFKHVSIDVSWGPDRRALCHRYSGALEDDRRTFTANVGYNDYAEFGDSGNRCPPLC